MNYKKGLVSIIIPVFNGEIYIEKCLMSVQKQTYTNLEIIIVDDGSQDSSLEICRNIANNDFRIIIIEKNNRGASEARNYGLRKAMGEYVVFIDCDDYIESGYIANLVSLMEEDVDLGVSGWKKINDKGELCEKCLIINKKVDPDNFFKDVVSVDGVRGYIVSKIFKNSIIKNYNIKFDDRIAYCEDLLFCCTYAKSCRKIKINTSYCDYSYVINQNSTTSLSFYSNSFDINWLYEIKTYELLINLLRTNLQALRILRARIALSSSFYLYRMQECNYNNKKIYDKLLKKLRNNLLFAIILKEGDSKWRMQAILSSMSPKLEFYIKKKLNSKKKDH